MGRAARALIYGLAGWCLEVVATAVHDCVAKRGDRRLEGRSYLWMPPVYATGGLAVESIYRRMGNRPWWQRGLAYAAACLGVEYVFGMLFRRVIGVCPWDYSDARLNVQGVIRLDFIPLWAAAGLTGEQLSILLRRVEFRPVDKEGVAWPTSAQRITKSCLLLRSTFAP